MVCVPYDSFHGYHFNVQSLGFDTLLISLSVLFFWPFKFLVFCSSFEGLLMNGFSKYENESKASKT